MLFIGMRKLKSTFYFYFILEFFLKKDYMTQKQFISQTKEKEERKRRKKKEKIKRKLIRIAIGTLNTSDILRFTIYCLCTYIYIYIYR